MDRLDALDLAHEEFRRRLRQVRDEQWTAPTPCEDWSVRGLVAHVVGGDRMAATILRGGSREEGKAAVQVDADTDLVAAFDEGADALARAFAEPGALTRVCAHPMADLAGSALLGFRIGDLVLHAWDLARGIGVDDALNPALVEVVWRDMEPRAGMIGTLGLYGSGPSGRVGPGAALQERLLDLSGRRPHGE